MNPWVAQRYDACSRPEQSSRWRPVAAPTRTPSPAAGVDELVIPTPSPDPDDFVATIDNPWLPLRAGRDAGPTPTAATDVTFSADEGPTIAGVADHRASRRGGSADYYAQDADGNVWWFGREGEWQAGEDGAEAGIAMLAKPRVGDGYAEMGADGEPGQRSLIKEPRRRAGHRDHDDRRARTWSATTSAAPGWC